MFMIMSSEEVESSQNQCVNQSACRDESGLERRISEVMIQWRGIQFGNTRDFHRQKSQCLAVIEHSSWLPRLERRMAGQNHQRASCPAQRLLVSN
jgi:hypothetical protein